MNILNHKPRLAAGLVSLCCLSASAATPAAEPEEHIVSTCREFIGEAAARVQKGLDDYPALRDDPALVLALPFGEFNAATLFNQNKIIIPLGWCIEIAAQAGGTILVMAQPTPQARLAASRQLVQYIDMLERRHIRAQKEGLRSPGPFARFRVKGGLDWDDLEPELRRKLLLLQDDLVSASLMFVIGHELGHLALRHKPSQSISSAESKAQEYAADRFSFDLLASVGLAPIDQFGALLGFQRFMAREAIMKGTEHAGTHPRPECRASQWYQQSKILDSAAGDPRIRAKFEASGVSLARSRHDLRLLDKDCRASEPGYLR